MTEISPVEAKHLILNSQLLGGGKPFSPLKVIQHLGYIQIDTISVVERAHHHVLWSRNPSYRIENLSKLLKQRKIFEYWSHAASYLPIEHYRYSLPKKIEYRNGKSHFRSVDKRTRRYVLDKVTAEGALMSKDFKSNVKSSGWYSWKPAKSALEQLFMEGRLMVCERRGFQKVYDLAERVVPDEVETSQPSQQEQVEHLIETQLKALGLANAGEIAYLRNGKTTKLVKQTLESMVEDKTVERLQVSGDEYFALPGFEKKLKAPDQKLRLLSPFDNFIIQRERLQKFFDFDYKIECYVPLKKRQYGYFTPPLLFGDRLIGREYLKAHRDRKELEVITLFSEKSQLTKTEQQKFESELKSFEALHW